MENIRLNIKPEYTVVKHKRTKYRIPTLNAYDCECVSKVK